MHLLLQCSTAAMSMNDAISATFLLRCDDMCRTDQSKSMNALLDAHAPLRLLHPKACGNAVSPRIACIAGHDTGRLGQAQKVGIISLVKQVLDPELQVDLVILEQRTNPGAGERIPIPHDPIPHDREKYRWRNLVERLFSKLKNWRRVATRYDKTKESYLGFVALASIKLWIPFVHDA
jgi:hypothetical protein